LPQFVIEREMPGAGQLSPEDLKMASQTSCSVLRDLGPQIQWVHSYVTDNKIYCVYRAPSEELIREHAQRGGFPANKISQVRTTIDPRYQYYALSAIRSVLRTKTDPAAALVAIDPRNGKVRAMAVWVPSRERLQFNLASQGGRQAGSSFKPFDLVAALQNGKGLGTTYDGTSPRKFPGVSTPIRNSGNDNSCGKECPVRTAMIKSLNTVFYDMVVNDVGVAKTVKAAHQAGIPEQVNIGNGPKKLLVGEDGGTPNGGIALGGDQAVVRPFDMASAYATFAARGVYRQPFFIVKITGPDGGVLYQNADKPLSAFDPDQQKSQQIADNVTEVLKEIPKRSSIPCAQGRECAGKTGTHELDPNVAPGGKIGMNSKAWMVGYTPSLSTAVWVGRNEGNLPIRDAKGNNIFGSGVPGKIWQAFMNGYLKASNAPAEPFPPGASDLPHTPTTR